MVMDMVSRVSKVRVRVIRVSRVGIGLRLGLAH